MTDIQHYNGLNRTPAIAVAVEAWHALLSASHAEPLCLLHWEQQAIVGSQDGHVVGVIIWTAAKWLREAEINIGYVRPMDRHRGHYRAMFEALVAKARDLGLTQITGGTHAGNAAMRTVAAALGRVETGVLLRYEIPPAPGA